MTDNWTKEQTRYLISLYRQSECLYNIRHKYYLNKNKRHAELLNIQAEMKNFKPEVTVQQIKNKIRTITNQVSKERQKIIKSRRSGAGTSDVYRPTLWCFNDLDFLFHLNDEKMGQSNIDFIEDQQDDQFNNVEEAEEAGESQISGDMICSECGLVGDDRVIDVGFEWRTFGNEKSGVDPSRFSGQENALLSGGDLSTKIGSGTGAASFDSFRINFPKIIIDRVNNLFEQKKTKTNAVAMELKETAQKSLDMISKFFNNKPAVKSREDLFCELLCQKLKGLKLQETLDDVEIDILNLVNEAKKKETRQLQQMNTDSFVDWRGIPSTSSTPISFNNKSSAGSSRTSSLSSNIMSSVDYSSPVDYSDFELPLRNGKCKIVIENVEILKPPESTAEELNETLIEVEETSDLLALATKGIFDEDE